MGPPRPTPVSEADILARLRAGQVQLPPLDFKWEVSRGKTGPDAIAKVAWGKQTYRFAVEIRSRSIPKLFGEALEQAKASTRSSAKPTDHLPMILLPYLAPERLAELERQQVSGLDLCGNGIVVVPGKLCILRTGNANTFRESFPIRDVYRGTTSLVARALLVRPTSESLGALVQFIRSRGGEITPTTVSKALRRLEDDVLIARKGGQATLLQPGALLDQLAASYRPPKVRAQLLASTRLTREELCARAARDGQRMVLSGVSSTERYAVMGRQGRVQIYCASIAAVQKELGADLVPDDRFATVELLETEDPVVSFDARIVGTVPFASPVQTYLELAAGDKREQDAAAQVKAFILGELEKRGTVG